MRLKEIDRQRERETKRGSSNGKYDGRKVFEKLLLHICRSESDTQLNMCVCVGLGPPQCEIVWRNTKINMKLLQRNCFGATHVWNGSVFASNIARDIFWIKKGN